MLETLPITVLIVEDHEIMRFGLKSVFADVPSIDVIGEGSDGESALLLAAQLDPDVVLMDIGLPGMSGIEATYSLRQRNARTKVIIFTSSDSEAVLFAALAAGADGYCVKSISKDQLIVAIRSVMSGSAWLDPKIAWHLLEATGPNGSTKVFKNPKKPLGLSKREVEVLKLISDGFSNQQIADRLQIGLETIKTHVKHIMEKLSVSDRTQAAVKAMQQGWL